VRRASQPSVTEVAKALQRERILDATDALLRERPWSEVRMVDISAAAGVSRQTLYNEFGGRHELAQAYVLREAGTFLVEVERAVAASPDDARRALTDAFALFLGLVDVHPLLRSVRDPAGDDGLLAVVTTEGAPVLGFATARLAAVMQATWPQLSADDAGLVADGVVRLAISHAALPGGPPEVTAASVARLLGPFLDVLLGTP
jgi:AcrR family transcriptional regulator